MPSLRKLIDRKIETDTGVGDTVKRVTSAIGIKPCGGCQKRAEVLNKMFPYKKKCCGQK